MPLQPDDAVFIRPAADADRGNLLLALRELHEYERALHDTRLASAQIADAYLSELESRAARDGAFLIAESPAGFAGFIVGWIDEANEIAETPDSNRFGYISDICVMPAFRGARVAARLIEELERKLWTFGVARIRLNALAANRSAHAAYERAGYASYEIVFEKKRS